MIEEVATSPQIHSTLDLAQRVLVDHLEENYDLYAYFEDDLDS